MESIFVDIQAELEANENQDQIFDENQTYIVTFNRRRRCDKAATEILNEDKLPEDAIATLNINSCTGFEKFLSCTLNLEALNWVRTDKL